jgi:hypothetical protein
MVDPPMAGFHGFPDISTGEIPENINFPIKTGALLDFLHNSVVPSQVADAKAK